MNFSPIPREQNDFQQSLTAVEITAVAAAAFGSHTTLTSARELGSGMFNNTYLLITEPGESFVLRVAPGEGTAVFTHEQRLLQREQAIEPPLRQVLGDLVPRTVFTDFSQQIINRDYTIQTMLAGELWDEIKDELTTAESDALWQQLADIALVIHQVPGTSFGLPQPEPPHARWSDAITAVTQMMGDNLQMLGLSTEGIEPFLEVLAQGAPLLDSLTTPRLVHGDLWPKNLLIDRSVSPPRIVGLLDAERGYWGDPLGEWIFYYLDIPAPFWDVYGRPVADPTTRFRQAACHGQFAIQLLLEADRFQWDAEIFRTQLQNLTQTMKEVACTT